MEREKFEILVIDYLSDRLDKYGQNELEEFLEKHPEYQKQFNDQQLTWKQMDSIEFPELSEEMDVKFYAMLSEKTQSEGKPFKKVLSPYQVFIESLRPQLAYYVLVLAIGLTIGYFLNTGNTIEPNTVATNVETEEVREKLVLTLLEQPSANKRLQGLSEANKIEQVNEKVIEALLRTLNNDPNVNVRLASIVSLTNYVDDPRVRKGLILAITQQESPIVQITLANLMVSLQEKESISPFIKLIETKELDETVKKELENAIQQII